MALSEGFALLGLPLVFTGVHLAVVSVQSSVGWVKRVSCCFTDRCDVCDCVWCDSVPDLNKSGSGYELKPHDALQCQTDGQNHRGHHKPAGHPHPGRGVRRCRTLAHSSRSVAVSIWFWSLISSDLWRFLLLLMCAVCKNQSLVLCVSPQRFLKQTRALKKGWSSKLSSSSSWMRSLPSYTLHFLEAGG